jgi:hypothetical protein
MIDCYFFIIGTPKHSGSLCFYSTISCDCKTESEGNIGVFAGFNVIQATTYLFWWLIYCVLTTVSVLKRDF